jgi:hypothetical protein
MTDRMLRMAIGFVVMTIGWSAAHASPTVREVHPPPPSPATCSGYCSLSSALASITTASSTNPYEILVYPGVYTGNANGGLRWKSWVSLRGTERDTTVIRGTDDTATMYGPYTTEHPLLDLTGLEGISISDITLDGTAQREWEAIYGGQQADYVSGAVWVCGAKVNVKNVRYLNGDGYSASGSSFSSRQLDSPYTCSGPGDIDIIGSDLAPVYEWGGAWTIADSRITTEVAAGTNFWLAWAYIHAPVPGYAGKVSISNTVIESTVPPGSFALHNWPLTIYGRGSEMRIVGSSIVARTFGSGENAEAAAVFVDKADDAGDEDVLIDGSLIRTESSQGATGGEFYGIYEEPLTGGYTFSDLRVHGSVISSVGSGGTRADVRHDGDAVIALASTEYSSTSGSSASTLIKTSDLKQGKFSEELVAPTASSSLPISDGRIWIDTTTNKLCYRSNGVTRCVSGS